MSVMGETKCGFCRLFVALPCLNSGEASRCVRSTYGDKPFTSDDAVSLLRKASAPVEPLDVQIGGDHYKRMKIQPLTYIEANELGFTEGNVIKYVSRWKFKNGIQDLEKARDMLTKKIAFEKEKQASANSSKP